MAGRRKAVARLRRGAAVSGAALLLAACTPATSGDLGATNGEPVVVDPAAQWAFIDCLEAQGVETLLAGGAVFISDFVVDDALEFGIEPTAFAVRHDVSGPWAAVRSSADLAQAPELQGPFAYCEAAVPQFTQPEQVGPGPEQTGDRSEYLELVQFIRCGQDAGHDWIIGAIGNTVHMSRDITAEELEHLYYNCLEFGATHQVPQIYCPIWLEGGAEEDCDVWVVRDRWLDHRSGITNLRESR